MDTQYVGNAILQRIAVREHARLQAHFLRQLYRHPESENIVLCGSAALHGVYLHKRWSKDLDFAAPPETAARFRAIAAECDLVLTDREGLAIGNDETRSAFTFAQPSVFYPEVSVAVEVFSKEMSIAPERRPFKTLSGDLIPVVARPIYQMLALKIGCISLRYKALDYVDLWLGLQSDPALKYEVRRLLIAGTCHAGVFTPPRFVDVGQALERLDQHRAAWDQTLSVYMNRVPSFEQVRDDLANWLPFFAANAK